MARFFLPKRQLRDQLGIVEGAELTHLRTVLRLAVGDRIVVFDDDGWEHEAVLRRLTPERGEIEILRSYRAERDSPLAVTLAVGLTKGEKLDWVVEKATELGVHRIVPFASSFAVPKWDERKIAARAARWQKIALSAVKQCGRTRVPEVLPLCDFDHLVREAWQGTLKLIFWEKERQRSLEQIHAREAAATSILLAVGPEGGFADSETAAAEAHGFQIVGLGRRILRAETAALTALGLVQYLWGDLK